MLGRLLSNVYLARPVTLSGPSRRLTDVPRTEGLAGHAHFLARSLMGCSAGFCGLATRHPPCFHRRFEDTHERAAAADITVEPLTNLLGRGVRIFLQQADCRHDETRRAEAAHQRIRIAECLLYRMQPVAVRQTVDRADALSLNLD